LIYLLVLENIDILKKRSNNTGLSSKFLVGDANTKVGEVVNEIKSIENNRPKNSWSSLNLAFLDPDGLELEWKTVAELASIKKMDLIIYYSQSGLTRNLDKFSNTHEENIIDRFFGDREWRRIFNDFKNSTGLHRHLIDYYKKKLGNLGYVDVKDIEDGGSEPLMRNTKQAPLYRLLFASKHKRGHDFWKQVIKRNVYGRTRLF